jgi:hypothetical protein
VEKTTKDEIDGRARKQRRMTGMGVGNAHRQQLTSLSLFPSLYLSFPPTSLYEQQETHEGESADFVYGVSAMQGWRTEMVRREREEK